VAVSIDAKPIQFRIEGLMGSDGRTDWIGGRPIQTAGGVSPGKLVAPAAYEREFVRLPDLLKLGGICLQVAMIMEVRAAEVRKKIIGDKISAGIDEGEGRVGKRRAGWVLEFQ